jgi:hypothetical protein
LEAERRRSGVDRALSGLERSRAQREIRPLGAKRARAPGVPTRLKGERTLSCVDQRRLQTARTTLGPDEAISSGTARLLRPARPALGRG